MVRCPAFRVKFCYGGGGRDVDRNANVCCS